MSKPNIPKGKNNNTRLKNGNLMPNINPNSINMVAIVVIKTKSKMYWATQYTGVVIPEMYCKWIILFW